VATNIEIKARATDFQEQMRRAAQLADGPGEILIQEDVFFHSPNGRLKLRLFEEGHGKLIGYLRPDQQAPGPSNYFLCPMAQPELAQKALEMTCGVRGRVRKKRTLFLVGPTRIHLDDVTDLGKFIELEVVLDQNTSEESGREIANDLMARLGITPNDLLSHAYIDLLTEQDRS